MKGNAKKILALVMIFAFTMAVASCGTNATTNTGSTTANNSGTSAAAATTAAANALPIVTKPLTLTLFVSPPNAAIANSMGDLETMKKIEEITGITIDFRHPSATDKGEALSTMLASGQYTDMIRSSFSSYKGGLDGAIEDDIILDYTSMVSQYAVNYNKLVAENGMEKLVLTDTGKQTGFGSTFSPEEFINRSFSGLVIRKDWLDDLNLALPVTVDDWHTVLTAFKEKKGCEAPLGLSNLFSGGDASITRAQIFVGSYGAAYTFLLSNDVVKYGPTLPAFKTFLETYSKWYAEGLIDQDIATHDYGKNIKPMLASGQVGATTMHPSTIPTIYAMVDKTKDADYALAPCAYPQVTKGVACDYRHNHLGVNISPILVSTDCKNPVEAVKFIDFLYSKQGIDLCTWGIQEGKSYTMDSAGVHHFGTLITANPDGLTATNARNKYTLDCLQMQWNWEYEQQQYVLPEQLNSTWGLWTSSSTAKNYIPEVISMTADETSTYTTVMAQVDPYAQEMILKYIMGLEPLTSFDKFVSTIKSMGIEKAENAKQAAYERYKKR